MRRYPSSVFMSGYTKAKTSIKPQLTTGGSRLADMATPASAAEIPEDCPAQGAEQTRTDSAPPQPATRVSSSQPGGDGDGCVSVCVCVCVCVR